MPLHDRILVVVRHGVKIEVERLAWKEPMAIQLLLPTGEQPRGFGGVEARGVFLEMALLGDGVEPSEERQALVSEQSHDVAVALRGPELQSQASLQGMFCGNHLGAGKVGCGRQRTARFPHRLQT
jgi:hypothetical protein